jgi:hypothetical protein
MNIVEQNRSANVYKKEADKYGIGSPYRIHEYIKLRMKGVSPEKAIAKVKSPK